MQITSLHQSSFNIYLTKICYANEICFVGADIEKLFYKKGKVTYITLSHTRIKNMTFYTFKLLCSQIPYPVALRVIIV